MSWRCEVFNDLIVRHWESEVFLFNPHTGDTHILNDIAWQLLCACADESRSESALQDLLAVHIGAENGGELSEAVNDHMDQLMQLGLIEQCAEHDAH